ncbi:MAG: protein translocase subunit secA, partial [Humibacillus sp.]|nr:protein translocase subunit secA [Humibacillus sp.]
LQNYFRMYDKLSGMTGTAQTEAAELNSIYKLGVIPIPTNRPMVRQDQADLVYRTEVAKYDAVVDDIAQKYAVGQPVLVGTVSVEKSEYLSQQLKKRGIKHEVLNAKQHEREAAIVADAGRKGAVTVATNMAGRGTDIMLGGNSEFRAVAELKRRGLDPHETPEDYEAAWDEALATAEQAVAAEHEEVTELGGLYVLGTERHESRRIDNQLRGRSGRQGDPGESRFYLSLNDDLMRLFNAGLVDRFMQTAGMEDDVPIESKMVSNSIQKAQGSVEAQNYEIRKNVLKYDDVMNRQRQVIYDERRAVLQGQDLHEQLRMFVNDVVGSYVDAATAEGFAADWELERLWEALRQVYPVGITVEQVEDLAGGRQAITAQMLREQLMSDAHHAYDQREESLGEETMREVERRVVLSVLDRKWREHLYEMDYLQEGIGLRAMAQRDPLIEYQREGYQLFEAMMEAIKEDSVSNLFSVEVQVTPPAPAVGAAPMAVGDLVGALSGGAAAASGVSDATGAAASGHDHDHTHDHTHDHAADGDDARDHGHDHDASGRPVARPAVQVSGVDLAEARSDAPLRYSAPGEDGQVVEVETQRTAERQADRRGKKVKRKRR